MSTDCGDKDDRVLRMAKRATCCEIVGRRAGGCSDTNPVGLDSREVLVVPKDLNGGHGCERLATLELKI